MARIKNLPCFSHRGTARRGRPEGLLKRQLSAHQLTVGTALCRGAEAGTSQASGVRCSPSSAQGATMGPSTLTKPRSLEKIKSFLGTKHQMASFQIRLSKCPEYSFFSAHPQSSPSDCTCPPISCSSLGPL